jgi:hypothetical protein
MDKRTDIQNWIYFRRQMEWQALALFVPLQEAELSHWPKDF